MESIARINVLEGFGNVDLQKKTRPEAAFSISVCTAFLRVAGHLDLGNFSAAPHTPVALLFFLYRYDFII